MTSQKPRVLILGAGVTGLSAAYHLTRQDNYQVTVLEKADRVGGLASSFKLGPAIFDFGPHAFHSQQPYIIDFFQKVMDGDYNEIEKDVAIKFQGEFYPYPLNPVQALRRMPLSVSMRCGISYFWNLLTNFKSMESLKTSEEFFVRNFGWELYRIFFEKYTEKVWGIHPRDLSAKFIKNRLPSANLLRIFWSSLTGRDIRIRKAHEVPLKLRIFYPKEGSIQFPDALRQGTEQKGGQVLLSREVTGIEISNGRAIAVRLNDKEGEHRLECDILISTIPLPELIQKFIPPPAPQVLVSAQELGFRPILIACLWINKPTIFPRQTIYYTNRIFNRLAQMNSYSATTTPAGTCGITAELTCRVKDPIWIMPEQELIAKIVADMEAEHLITKEDVKEWMILRNVHGYPIYEVGFEEHLQRLRKTIHDIPNLYAAGRQGMFNYAQMHYGVNAGRMIADHLNKGEAKPALSVEDTEETYFA